MWNNNNNNIYLKYCGSKNDQKFSFLVKFYHQECSSYVDTTKIFLSVPNVNFKIIFRLLFPFLFIQIQIFHQSILAPILKPTFKPSIAILVSSGLKPKRSLINLSMTTVYSYKVCQQLYYFPLDLIKLLPIFHSPKTWYVSIQEGLMVLLILNLI